MKINRPHMVNILYCIVRLDAHSQLLKRKYKRAASEGRFTGLWEITVEKEVAKATHNDNWRKPQ